MTSCHASSTTATQPGALFFLLGQIPGLQPRSPFDQNMYCISLPSMTHSRNGPIYFLLQISQVQQIALQNWMVEYSKEQPEPTRHQNRNQMHWNLPWKLSWTTYPMKLHPLHNSQNVCLDPRRRYYSYFRSSASGWSLEWSSGESDKYACLIHNLPTDSGKMVSFPDEPYFWDTAWGLCWK